MWYLRVLLLGAVAIFMYAGSASAFLFHPGGGAVVQPITKTLKATLNGASEVPPNKNPGTGAATVILNPTTRYLTWNVTYSGLDSPAKSAGIYGPAEPGKKGPEVIRFSDLTSPIKGSEHLTSQEVASLEAGKYYVNIRTTKHQTGEIRGQLTP